MLTNSNPIANLSNGCRTYSLLLLWVTMLLVSCTHNPFSEDLFSENRITFATDLPTRGSLYTELGNLFTTMGVYASVQGDEDFNENSEVILMIDKLLERSSGSDGWRYTPPVGWNAGKHSFFAYAPHVSDAVWMGVNAPVIESSNEGQLGVPRMTYQVPLAVQEQTDLLIAAAQYNLVDTLTGSVKMVMNHALTRVVFSARIDHPVHVDSAIKVTKVEFTDVQYKGTHVMDFQPAQTWTTTADKQTFTITDLDGLRDITLDQSLQNLTTSVGSLFMMPQTFFNSQATLKITYRTYLLSDNSKYKDVVVTKKIEDILDSWNQGESVRFLITIPNPAQPADFSVSVTYEPWEDRTTDVSIPSDPFLDITNVEVHTYDAAATRVYFYTNQPFVLDGKPNIYIEPQGREGSNSGSIFDVQKEFQSLVSTDPLGAANLHFDGATGKGYIDLINVNTAHAGDRPSNGKNLLVLKLRAGKLVRDISVQPVVTAEIAKQNATPYVGTFHRHSERGERIVTWHLPTSTTWTAEIVDEANSNHADLCIDRLSSPDYTHNSLFSNLPRDPEGANVTPDVRSVRGMGRVYFRVGWKSTSLLANRYARIRVSETISGGTTTIRYLYCRQGETEDRITVAAQTYFAVYNTAQPRTFAKYPSQVGMGYQWNRMKAWEPLSVPTPPGFPLYPGTAPYQYDINLPFSAENNACPEGYLYPNQAALNEMSVILTNFADNFTWGYYADGFFDRRSITVKDQRVDASTLEVASAGYVLSTPAVAGGAPKSIFLSTGGDRDNNGVLTNIGSRGIYWSQEAVSGNPEEAKVGIFSRPGYGTSTVLTPHEKWHTHSLRCVKPLPGAAWVIRFHANKGENAPVTITVPYHSVDHPKITLPSGVPNNYYRDEYEFKGWNTKPDGSGFTYAPGGTYNQGALSASAIPATAPNALTLYAKWVKDPYLKLDFRTFAGTAPYLLSSGSYNGYDIGRNGTKYANQSAVMNLTTGEKAYPNLKFTAEQPATTWSAAYNNCKNLSEDGGGWRLPRAVEMQLINNNTPVAALQSYGGILLVTSPVLWTGTESPSGSYYVSWYGGLMSDPISSGNYRCVKEL